MVPSETDGTNCVSAPAGPAQKAAIALIIVTPTVSARDLPVPTARLSTGLAGVSCAFVFFTRRDRDIIKVVCGYCSTGVVCARKRLGHSTNIIQRYFIRRDRRDISGRRTRHCLVHRAGSLSCSTTTSS